VIFLCDNKNNNGLQFFEEGGGSYNPGNWGWNQETIEESKLCVDWPWSVQLELMR
jgi:hypothetical protein